MAQGDAVQVRPLGSTEIGRAAAWIRNVDIRQVAVQSSPLNWVVALEGLQGEGSLWAARRTVDSTSAMPRRGRADRVIDSDHG